MTGMWVWIVLAGLALMFAAVVPFVKASRSWCVAMAINIGLGAGIGVGLSYLGWAS